jgi:hypothetical protein
MSDNGWPGKPGVPMNPEREGWHWVQRVRNSSTRQPMVAFWSGDWNGSIEFAWCVDGYSDSDDKFGDDFCYLGLCLTPAEVDARIAQARRDALEEAMEIAFKERFCVERYETSPPQAVAAHNIIEAIRALADKE